MYFIGSKVIETQRLLLRPFTLQDADAMFLWAGDRKVTKYLRYTTHENVQESRKILTEWVQKYSKPDFFVWAIQLKETNEVIGSIGVLYSDIAENGIYPFEPGYCIAKKFWGKGYVSEALGPVIGHVFKATNTGYMLCCHAITNPASGSVMRKFGFCYTHNSEYTKLDGTHILAMFYRLDKQNFKFLV